MIELYQGGAGALLVRNNNSAEQGQTITIEGVNLVQGPDDGSNSGYRNAYYPNETVVFKLPKDLATDFTPDDDEIFWDTVNKKAVTATGTDIVKFGRKFPSGIADEMGGRTTDDFVLAVHTIR